MMEHLRLSSKIRLSICPMIECASVPITTSLMGSLHMYIGVPLKLTNKNMNSSWREVSVYRVIERLIKPAIVDDTPKDVAADPTLSCRKAVRCALYGHEEAIFFQERFWDLEDLCQTQKLELYNYNASPLPMRDDIGVAVVDSTDVAQGVSNIVLTEPGVSVIVNVVLTSRGKYLVPS
uniref:ATPase 3, plasma membrane-type n=1 Tax=Tanacetum cinerariifolium TaxID=118510 RepID=A0A699GUR9_TANCI|nr:ATPase 3, plasma membrane-type [Tanacetum cinerariifolium]